MKVTRRQFVKGGVAAFTVTFAAPEFLSRPGARAGRARAQPGRALSERRQRLAQHAHPVQRSVLLQPRGRRSPCRPASVLQIGTDSSRVALGLHPRLTGLKQIFDQGRLALVQRTGYGTRAARTSRAPTSGRPPIPTTRRARLGRPLSRFAAVAGRSARRLEHDAASLPHVLQAAHTSGAGDPESGRLRVLEPEQRRRSGGRAQRRRSRIASHVPVDRPELAFVYGSAQAALAHARSRRDRRGLRADASPTRTTASARRCRPSRARWSKAIGTRVFYVTTGGFDTHSAQNVNATNGAYYNLMATLNDGAARVLQRPARTRGCSTTRWSSASRSSAAASTRTAARAPITAPASVMMAMGGRVQRRPLRHGARTSITDPSNPTLENNAADVRFETDFRSVYAQVIDGWLGGDSRASCWAATSGKPGSTFI